VVEFAPIVPCVEPVAAEMDRAVTAAVWDDGTFDNRAEAIPDTASATMTPITTPRAPIRRRRRAMDRIFK
jgi:hypothetical protein